MNKIPPKQKMHQFSFSQIKHQKKSVNLIIQKLINVIKTCNEKHFIYFLDPKKNVKHRKMEFRFCCFRDNKLINFNFQTGIQSFSLGVQSLTNSLLYFFY